MRDFESEVRLRSGGTMWISEYARAVRDGNGQLLYYEGFVSDVSARRRLEAEIARIHLRKLGADHAALADAVGRHDAPREHAGSGAAGDAGGAHHAFRDHRPGGAVSRCRA